MPSAEKDAARAAAERIAELSGIPVEDVVQALNEVLTAHGATRLIPPATTCQHVWVESVVTSGPTRVGETLTLCALCGGFPPES